MSATKRRLRVMIGDGGWVSAVTTLAVAAVPVVDAVAEGELFDACQFGWFGLGDLLTDREGFTDDRRWRPGAQRERRRLPGADIEACRCGKGIKMVSVALGQLGHGVPGELERVFRRTREVHPVAGLADKASWSPA